MCRGTRDTVYYTNYFRVVFRFISRKIDFLWDRALTYTRTTAEACSLFKIELQYLVLLPPDDILGGLGSEVHPAGEDQRGQTVNIDVRTVKNLSLRLCKKER